MWMNEWDIREAVETLGESQTLCAATHTLRNLMNWTNANSDGWPYWQKPARAADRLMYLIEDARKTMRRGGNLAENERQYALDYKKALAPIKSFRTRQSADFQIVEVGR